MVDHTLLKDTLARLSRLQMHLEITADPADKADWIDAASLAAPEEKPLSDLMTRFTSIGFGPNKRGAAASLLLRFGWASGFAIASYFVTRRVPVLRDYALHFSTHTLLKAIWVRDVGFITADDCNSENELRHHLLKSLIGFTEPVLAAQHKWSRFSRYALWGQVTSSWGAQFSSIARQLGDAERGIAEARATFALDPEIAKAAPELYEVKVEETACTCQRRASCCLYFKTPGKAFCASCPIIPEAERLERNRVWVAQQRPLVSA